MEDCAPPRSYNAIIDSMLAQAGVAMRLTEHVARLEFTYSNVKLGLQQLHSLRIATRPVPPSSSERTTETCRRDSLPAHSSVLNPSSEVGTFENVEGSIFGSGRVYSNIDRR